MSEQRISREDVASLVENLPKHIYTLWEKPCSCGHHEGWNPELEYDLARALLAADDALKDIDSTDDLWVIWQLARAAMLPRAEVGR